MTVKLSMFDYKNIHVEYVFGFDLSQKSQPQPLLQQKHVFTGHTLVELKLNFEFYSMYKCPDLTFVTLFLCGTYLIYLKIQQGRTNPDTQETGNTYCIRRTDEPL